ncbi:MAG: type II secretion system F family protein [Thiomonas arsenitoxydans]|uniref:Type II secretion system F family protein n=1 Tax=Thiomonas arsenitoxydans (strain DSM 22701 / CIP 110005 / 3As) TaxID=426114 RepID=A0A8I1N179_THIA3|nr:type II secretion system F family protein [Thiomonas arsenitoxydans]MBN8745712.1 type II secretion system F family protein [Thiomonas arsenitoxydans]
MALALALTVMIVLTIFAVLLVLRQIALRQKNLIEQTANSTLVELLIFIDTRQLLAVNLALIAVFPLLVWLITQSPVLTVAIAVAMLYFPQWLVRRLRERRLKRFIYQLPDGLLMLASSLRSGMGLNAALEIIAQEQPAPLSQEIALLLRQQRLGKSLSDALSLLETRLPMEEFRLFTAALRISRSVGGNLADTLESLSHTLIRKAEVEGKIESLTAQGRIQALVMTGLPILLILVLHVMQPGPMSYLFHSLVGWAVLALIVILETAGFFFIRKIVAIEI